MNNLVSYSKCYSTLNYNLRENILQVLKKEHKQRELMYIKILMKLTASASFVMSKYH